MPSISLNFNKFPIRQTHPSISIFYSGGRVRRTDWIQCDRSIFYLNLLLIMLINCSTLYQGWLDNIVISASFIIIITVVEWLQLSNRNPHVLYNIFFLRWLALFAVIISGDTEKFYQWYHWTEISMILRYQWYQLYQWYLWSVISVLLRYKW